MLQITENPVNKMETKNSAPLHDCVYISFLKQVSCDMKIQEVMLTFGTYRTMGHLIRAASRQNMSSGFPTGSDTNRTVQPQKMTRGFKFRIYEEEVLYYRCSARTKALVSCAVTAQLICSFVFAFAKIWFSDDAAHI